VKTKQISISIPGTAESIHDNQFINQLKLDLNVVGINCQIAHSIPECGCLNKEWLQFTCDVEMFYGWPSFIAFNGKMRGEKSLNQYYEDLLHYGKLIIQMKDSKYTATLLDKSM